MTPWAHKFRQVVNELVRPGDFEFLNHPFAVLVVVSSDNADPIGACDAAYNPAEVGNVRLVVVVVAAVDVAVAVVVSFF
jgi:hypothetical protein